MFFPDIKKALTEGLQAGFGGKSKFETVERGSFALKASEVVEGGVAYRDEWLPGRTGGGQELIRVGEQVYTRLYAGGVIREEELERLGIGEKQVIAYLKEIILKLGEQTRLEADCLPEPDEDWRYSYRVIEKMEALDMTVGKETIKYKEETVFVHMFLLCPVNP
jgi:hypothetical protein